MNNVKSQEKPKKTNSEDQVAATADNVINWPGLSAVKQISLAGVNDWLVPLSLMIMDYLAILLAISLAHVLRETLFDSFVPYHEPPLDSIVLFVFLPLLYLGLISFNGLYTKRLPFWQSAEKLFKVNLYSATFLVAVCFFFGLATSISRIFITSSLILIFIALLTERFLMKKALIRMGLWQQPIIIIGTSKAAETVAKSFMADPFIGYRVLGFIKEHYTNQDTIQDLPVLGLMQNLEMIVAASGIKRVLIAATEIDSKELASLVNRVQPLVRELIIVPNCSGMWTSNVEVSTLFDQKTILLHGKNNLASYKNIFLKISFDLCLGSLGLVCALPLLVMISYLIWISSPGPIFFGHQRLGQRGKSFKCYKFRTMVPNAEELLAEYLAANPEARDEWEANFKLKDDPRLTRIGSWLRKTSLDELPQLFNVIKGEMSLVGPRPIIKEELSKYAEVINDYYQVRPGITGYWQINGRNDVDYETRVQMDSWYVRNWSMWLDVALLCKTVKVVLGRKGAY